MKQDAAAAAAADEECQAETKRWETKRCPNSIRWEEEWRRSNFDWCEDAQRRYKDDRTNRKQMATIGGKQPYTWCKISLPKGYDLQKMVETMEKLQRDKHYMMGESLACYEFHSKNSPQGGNLHIHVVALGVHKYKRGALAAKLANRFGTLPNCVEVEIRLDGGLFQTRVDYTVGKKIEDKEGFVEKDKAWRDFHGIPHVSNSFPSGYTEKFINLI